MSTNADGKYSKTLREVVVPIVSEDDCRNCYSLVENANIDESVVCAGDIENGGKDACQVTHSLTLTDLFPIVYLHL